MKKMNHNLYLLPYSKINSNESYINIKTETIKLLEENLFNIWLGKDSCGKDHYLERKNLINGFHQL